MDDEEGGFDIVEEESIIGLAEGEDILIINLLLEFPAMVSNSTEDIFGRKLEIDDQGRGGDILFNKLINPFIESNLTLIKIMIGEDPILVEEIIGDDILIEELHLGDRSLLAVAGEEKEELGGEGKFFSILIETGKEGVVIDILKDKFGPELTTHELGQIGLARTEQPFNCNISQVTLHTSPFEIGGRGRGISSLKGRWAKGR